MRRRLGQLLATTGGAATTGAGSATTGGAATTAAGAATTAAGVKATGEPIVIGIYTPADNPSFTAPELIDGAEAATDYVNNQLGGIGGRPIQLESCTTDYTAPRLTACANELFQKQPLIIIPGPDVGALTVQATFDATGIPLIGGASFTPPEYTSPSRALFNGWSASLFPAMVHFASTQLHATNMAGSRMTCRPTPSSRRCTWMHPRRRLASRRRPP